MRINLIAKHLLSWLNIPLITPRGSLIPILTPLIVIILIGAAIGVYEFGVDHWPIPVYQGPHPFSFSEICKKMNSDWMKGECLSIIAGRDVPLDLDLLKPGCKTLGCGCRYCDDEKINTIFFQYISNRSICTQLEVDPGFVKYCLALVENPYFCSRFTILDTFLDHWSHDDCYIDAALSWKDPFLCERVQNPQDRDFCYLRLIKEL